MKNPMEHRDLVSGKWQDYELLDSGGNRKLERYGAYSIIRPETQAIWEPMRADIWKQADAEFRFVEGKGSWKKRNAPETWRISWDGILVAARLTAFKHTGIFPEQSPNWEWLRDRVGAMQNPRVLNLFGYTGVASLVAAKYGAQVTHVDASKQSNAWAKENAGLSGISAEHIRYILDDALKFSERESRRGARYDGIILDPPAFGRGPKGEVWKIEEDFPRLLEAAARIFSPKSGAFFLLNGYAAGYSSRSFRQAVQGVFSGGKGEYGELCIAESGSDRVIPAGIYARFVR